MGVGQRVYQVEALSIEAGLGSPGPYDYAFHIDLHTYGVIDGDVFYINPNLLARRLNPHDAILSVGVLRQGPRWVDAGRSRRRPAAAAARTHRGGFLPWLVLQRLGTPHHAVAPGS